MTGDELPLDKIMERVLLENRIQALLSPYKLAESRSSHSGGESSAGVKRMAEENTKLKNELKWFRSGGVGKAKGDGKEKGQKGLGKGNKGKDKDKGFKGKGRAKHGISLPRPLHGMNPVIDEKKICFDYNLAHGCQYRGVDHCPAGMHKCMYPGCGDDHSVTKCPIMLKKMQGVY